MRNHEQPQPLLITRQTNDRRGCRLLPVRKELKQAWLTAAYAGIESLKEIGTIDDLAKLKEMYTPKLFPNAPKFLREDLEKHLNYSEGRAEGHGHSVITGTIATLEDRFPEARSRPLIVTRMSKAEIGNFFGGWDWRAIMLSRDERIDTLLKGIKSLQTIGTKDDLVGLKEFYKDEEVVSSERPYWDDYEVTGHWETTTVYDTFNFPNIPWRRAPWVPLHGLDEGTHRVIRETIAALEDRFPEARSRPLIMTRMSQEEISNFFDGHDWRATMLTEAERKDALLKGIESLRETGTRDDLVRLKELYKDEEVVRSEDEDLRHYVQTGERRTRVVYTTYKFPNVPWLRRWNGDLDEGTHRVFRETIAALEDYDGTKKLDRSIR